MKYLKFAAFSFIAAIIISITELITHFEPLGYLAILAGLSCIGALLVGLFVKIFRKFKYSVNIIAIIGFAVVAIIAYVFQPETLQIVQFSDLNSLNPISLIALVSMMGVLVSLLVLVWRLIFTKKEKTLDDQVQSPKESENVD